MARKKDKVFDSNYKIENIEGSTLGLILILDHLENPVSFIQKFINFEIITDLYFGSG